MPSEDETPEERFEKDVANVRRADQRARKNLRQFIVANVLTRMWTLTYAPPFQMDRSTVVANVNDWLQELRQYLGENFPALYVLELHADGQRYHVHVAMESRFIDWATMSRLWGHGLVQFSDGNKAIRKHKTKRGQARCLARYLSKYLAKSWSDQHTPGDHRYEVTQGFTVQKQRRVFRSMGEALLWLQDQEGSPAQAQWNSDTIEDWHGPPCWVFTWD